MLKGYKDTVVYIDRKGLEIQFANRIEKIAELTFEQDWNNKYAFDQVLEKRY